MEIKTGIDIIEVKRIQEAIERQGEKFLKRVYTAQEIEYCDNTGKMRYQHYAARFAAKEAIFKAISPLLNNKYDITWLDIEILNDKQGRPYANLNKEKIDKKIQIDISISHIKEYAIANCVTQICE